MAGSGDLDRRITVLRSGIERDEFNNEIPTWFPLLILWAKWRPATARERLAQQEIGASVDDVFEIRWSTVAATVNPKDRLQFGDRQYDIIEANEVNRRYRIRIKASARSDTGLTLP
jgi:SPP1 family predicted phage head-tail adaptor